MLVVTGVNGAGKSTLLRVLAGLRSPSEGRVSRPERIGYAALDQSVYAQLTVREHMEWARDLRGAGGTEPGVYDLPGDERGEALSSGQRSRLRIALAAAHEPEWLLLDEPGAALDDAGTALIERTIADQRRRGATVIATNDPRERRFATHELEL